MTERLEIRKNNIPLPSLYLIFHISKRQTDVYGDGDRERMGFIFCYPKRKFLEGVRK